MQILNHLADLTEYYWDWTEQDKEILEQFENELILNGYKIKYMQCPVDKTIDGIIISAIARKFESEIKTGIDLYKELITDIETDKKYNILFDNIIYIYKVGKVKLVKDNITTFAYTMRIGSLFN